MKGVTGGAGKSGPRLGPLKEIRPLGTTWRYRGPPYWARRALLLVVAIALFAVACLITGSIFAAILQWASGVATVVLWILFVVGVSVSLAWGLDLLRRTDEEKALGVPMVLRDDDAPELSDAAVAARVRRLLHRQPFVTVAQLFLVGFTVAQIISRLQRYLSIDEFEAHTGSKAPRRRRVGGRPDPRQPKPIKKIRGLGTTWKERGVRYWARRVGWVAFALGLLAGSTWFVTIVFEVIVDSAAGVARVVVITIASAGVVGSFVWGFSLLKRTDEEKALGLPMIMRSGSTQESRNRAGWAGVSAGIVSSPLVLFAQVFVVGVVAAMVVSLLQKYVSIEEFEAVTGTTAPRRRSKPKLWSR